MNTKTRNRSYAATRTSQPFETSFMQTTWLQAQVRRYRISCGDVVKEKDDLSAEKLRKRRIADCKVFLNDDGFAAPGYSTSICTMIPCDFKDQKLTWVVEFP